MQEFLGLIKRNSEIYWYFACLSNEKRLPKFPFGSSGGVKPIIKRKTTI
jgi:hypothetical protein